jgi:hypothetical protein
MKLWRKMAMAEGKQDGRRPGRQIKRAYQMQEAAFKSQPRIYPLLARLLVHSGIATVGKADGTSLTEQLAEIQNETV